MDFGAAVSGDGWSKGARQSVRGVAESPLLGGIFRPGEEPADEW